MDLDLIAFIASTETLSFAVPNTKMETRSIVRIVPALPFDLFQNSLHLSEP